MANNVDPDQMPHSVASDLGLHCLLRPVCPNIYGYHGNFNLVQVFSQEMPYLDKILGHFNSLPYLTLNVIKSIFFLPICLNTA